MDFYREIVQPLKAWTPSAPKLRESEVAESAKQHGEEARGAPRVAELRP